MGPLDDEPENDDDPGQTAAIDGWIDAALLRHDVDFARDAKGTLMVANDPARSAPPPQNLAAVIELLVAGIYAAARGQELPTLPSTVRKQPVNRFTPTDDALAFQPVKQFTPTDDALAFRPSTTTKTPSVPKKPKKR